MARRHPFHCWQDVVYLGRRCNRTWGHAEVSRLVVGQTYLVTRCVFALAVTGDRIACVQLDGVPGVLLETGKRSRSFAAENFEPVP